MADVAADGVHAVDVRTGRPRWTFTVDALPPAAVNQPWGLATDGQRLLAKLGSTVFALPPA